MNHIRTKLWLLSGTLSFIGLFQWVYISWLHPTFDYIGFHYETPPLSCVILSWLLAALPSLWLAFRLERPSQLILWILYLAVFIPSTFVPLFIGLQSYQDVVILMLTLFGGFVVMSLGTALPILKLRYFKISSTVLWTGLWVVIFGLFCWVVTVFAGNIHLVSFHEVYEKIRFSGAEVASGTGVGYAVMWLAGAFNPFLMTWGLMYKRPNYFIIGALGQILLYCTGGLKSILLSVIILPALWMILRVDGAKFALRLTWGAAALLLVTNCLNQLAGEIGRTQMMFSAIVLMRTFGVPGLATGQYSAFFSDHPVTHLSHVSGINAFVDSPYQGSIGKEVGFFYSGNVDYNANAHLWSMDGLAGFGLPGILMISVLCALVFWILDSAVSGDDPRFAALATSFAAYNLSNVSLFTTLLSGGLFFSIALLYLKPRDIEDRTDTLTDEDWFEPNSEDDASDPRAAPHAVVSTQ